MKRIVSFLLVLVFLVSVLTGCIDPTRTKETKDNIKQEKEQGSGNSSNNTHETNNSESKNNNTNKDNTNEEASNNDINLSFNVISDENNYPIDRDLLNHIKENRGYYIASNNVLVSLGAKSQSGYTINLEKVEEVGDKIIITIKESLPNERNALNKPEYPSMMISFNKEIPNIKVIGNSGEVFKVIEDLKKEDEISIEAVDTEEVYEAKGFYIGEIDASSIEIKIGNEYRAFKSVKVKDKIEKIEDNSNVVFKYIENELGQGNIIWIEKE